VAQLYQWDFFGLVPGNSKANEDLISELSASALRRIGAQEGAHVLLLLQHSQLFSSPFSNPPSLHNKSNRSKSLK
jgi:hypothetical protein